MASEKKRHRPTEWRDYRQRQERMITPQGFERGLAFEPRPTDVLISPYAKSGTTWLQQIVHGLRTRGDMDFDDISRVVPWIETSSDLGIKLDAEQCAKPRAFKSHLSWNAIPKGGRYIVSLRDPKDALVSLFRFKEGWFFARGAFSIATFARREYFRLGKSRDYWHHFRSWWEHREDDCVLLLTFEDMKEDLPSIVRRVARFIRIELDNELLELVVRQASLDFMLAHKDRFDDRLMRERSEIACELPPGSDSAKVRKGEVGTDELPEEIRREMDEIWAQEIEAALGLRSYAAARRALSALQ